MEGVLRHIFGRFPLVAAAITLFGVLIWYVAPLISFAGVSPFSSEWARIAAIAVLVVVWAAYEAFRAWRAKRKEKALQEGLSAAEEGDREAKALGARMSEALGTLRKMGGKDRGNYLYGRPWYMIIGPPGSGKTTALMNAGLKFLTEGQAQGEAVSGVGGTRNCDWWFTEQAILIDTAGRYTTQDSNAERDARAWKAFLDLLRRNRPKQPLNGVLVAFGLDALMNASEAEIEAHARAVRRRLNELHETLGARIPVYLWLTKADVLPGFEEFFSDLSVEGRREVLGHTQPWQGAKPISLDAFADAFDALVKAIGERAPQRLQAEADAQRRSAVLGFANQVAEARPGSPPSPRRPSTPGRSSRSRRCAASICAAGRRPARPSTGCWASSRPRARARRGAASPAGAATSCTACSRT